MVMEVRSISLRVFLTSRPKYATLPEFRNLQEEDRQHRILYIIPEPIITRDISHFLGLESSDPMYPAERLRGLARSQTK